MEVLSKEVKFREDSSVTSMNDYFSFIQGRRSVNNTSYWLSQLYHCGLKTPETFILKLTSSEYRVLNRVQQTEDEVLEERACIHEVADKIVAKMKINGFNFNRLLVMKKQLGGEIDVLEEYVFMHNISNEKTLKRELLNALMIVVFENKGRLNELTIQSYYDKQNRPRVQNEIVLNTRLRVFYSFDTGEVLEVINCWDSIRLKQRLKGKCETKEQAILEIAKLEATVPLMNEDMRGHYYHLKAYLEEHLKELSLSGQWMLDILVTQDGYYVVEMKKEIQ